MTEAVETIKGKVLDGRYTLQAKDQVDTTVFTIVPIADTTPEAWLEANLPTDAKLGYDPWLPTVDGAERRVGGRRIERIEPSLPDELSEPLLVFAKHHDAGTVGADGRAIRGEIVVVQTQRTV